VGRERARGSTALAVTAGLVPAIYETAVASKNVDARASAAPKGLRPRRRDKPGHDDAVRVRALRAPE
jgi:hypothetical protein